MLGAQALRTKQVWSKQKAEQKEKEKRHKERQLSIQMERERMHKAARDEMTELSHETSLLHIRDPSHSRERRDSLRSTERSSSRDHPDRDSTPRHRHSIHNVHQLHAGHSSIRMPEPPQRSTSSDYCRAEKKESGNRFMRWLGFGEKKEKRRMSTF